MLLKKQTVNNRHFVRDLLVYTVTSVRYLLLKGELQLFIKDMQSFIQWRKYRTSGKGTLDFHIPWLVFSSISFIDRWLQKDMKLFEYGSGGSTLYFASRTAGVVSVEHDRNWFHTAEGTIAKSGYNNIDYRLIEPQPAVTDGRDCADPANYVSCFTEYSGFEFSAYAKAIEAYADASFDLVVVDGRVRHSCITHAISKVKKGGLLLVDNADRNYYLQPHPVLFDARKWKRIRFAGHFPFGGASVLNETMVFLKKME